MKADERAWALSRAKQVAEATVRNVMLLESLGVQAIPCAVPRGDRARARRGTFVVVGAGPSLSGTGHLLADFREAGAVIVTVNTALPAVRKFLEPDVVVVREIADVTSAMEGLGPKTLRVVDLAATTRVLQQAVESGPTAWFVSATTMNYELAARLGVRPLYGGSAALTAAVALADAWGAAEIVLLGVDLAIGPDGSTYAKGSAYEGQTATTDGDVVTLSGVGYEKRVEVSVSAGITIPAERTRAVSVPAYGGTGDRVLTQGVWVDQIEWLSNRAWRDMNLRCVDATGEGAAKPGWYEMEPSAALASLKERAEERSSIPLEDVPPGMFGVVLDWFAEQARSARMLAMTVVEPDGAVAAVPGIADMDIVALAAAPGQLRAIEGPGDIRAKIGGVYAALRSAADDIDAILAETTPDEVTSVAP